MFGFGSIRQLSAAIYYVDDGFGIEGIAERKVNDAENSSTKMKTKVRSDEMIFANVSGAVS